MNWTEEELKWIEENRELMEKGLTLELFKKMCDDDIPADTGDRIIFSLAYITDPKLLKLSIVGNPPYKRMVIACSTIPHVFAIYVSTQGYYDDSSWKEWVNYAMNEKYPEELETYYGKWVADKYKELVKKGILKPEEV